MKRPQFEDPIDTLKDLVDQNITIFEYDFLFNNLRSVYLSVNTSEWDSVAQTMVPAKVCTYCFDTNGTYHFYMKHHVHGNRSHAFLKGYLFTEDKEVMDKENWWRSKKIAYDNPYGGVMTSRNWILNEVIFFPIH